MQLDLRHLPEFIAALVKRPPGLRFATVVGSCEGLAARLRSGDPDFIVGARTAWRGPARNC
ncbi:MAG: hypothetical protein ABIR52_14700 [Casimicrobiaceae bacterium]